MAIASVTSTGTGEYLIKYTDTGSSTEKSLRVSSPIAGLSLDTANNPYKYKILSGTPTSLAGSGLTFTPIVSSYKKLVWDVIYPSSCSYISDFNLQFTSLIVGSTTYTFLDLVGKYSEKSAFYVADQIYKLNSPNITPTSYKYEIESKTDANNQETIQILKSSLVLNIEDLTGDVYLKFVDSLNSVEYLVKGVTEASAVPTGFTATTDPCGVN